MGRQPCCDKVGQKKGPWTVEEDQKLVAFLLTHGQYRWRVVPKLAGLMRCGKSCRLRWTNYLRPGLKRGILSDDEERLVVDMHAQIGNRWSKIAARLPGRTDNEIKNQWNTHIKKKLRRMGIDPDTHRPLQFDQTDQAPLPPPVPQDQEPPPPTDHSVPAEDEEGKALPMVTVPPYTAGSNCSASAIFSPSCSSSSGSASASRVDAQPSYPFRMDGFMDLGSLWDAGFFVSGVDSGFDQQVWF